jgi:hypothetical protein
LRVNIRPVRRFDLTMKEVIAMRTIKNAFKFGGFRRLALCAVVLPFAIAGCPDTDDGVEANLSENASAVQNQETAQAQPSSRNPDSPPPSASDPLPPGGQPPNPPFTVSAGADQTVEDNALVALPAAVMPASADLTFRWAQVAGEAVTLSGADTATLAFTAPNRSATLTFRVSVASPQGRAEDDVSVIVNASPILIIANRGGSITQYLATPRLNGDAVPLRSLSGSDARLSGPSNVLMDRIGGLIVTNAFSNRIAGYLNAAALNGNVAPERYVGGGPSLISQPEAAAYDPVTDVLYVGNFDGMPGTVNVYAGVSTAAFFGELPPARQIRSNGIMNPRDLELTESGDLYVLNAGSHTVSVFSGVPSLNGATAPTRAFWSAAMLDQLTDSELVADTLLVVDATNRRVLMFDGVSQLDGESSPARILSVPGFGQLGGVAVDPAGTAYISDGTNNAIYIYSSVLSRNGAIEPDRTLAGPKTGLSAPGHMTLMAR